VQVIENPEGRPGEVEVVLGDRDIGADLLAAVKTASRTSARPASSCIAGRPRRSSCRSPPPSPSTRPSEREQAEIQKRLGGVLADYFGTLKVGEAVREAKIRALLLGHDAVVGCERSGQRPLLEPFVWKDGTVESIAFRADGQRRRDGPPRRTHLPLTREAAAPAPEPRIAP
jgi:hypothetical protein